MAVPEFAYRLRSHLKKPGDSLSDVIVRLSKRGSYRRVPDEEAQTFRHKLARMRRRSDEKLSDTVRRLRW